MRILLCAALLAASIAASARADNLLDLTVVDRDTGATLSTYADRGKLYVAGTPGHRYSVRLTNRSGGRVLAVLSVDGVNAVSGETGSPDQTGYVLAPFESAEISGWRKNLDEVAQFNFTALPNSYAARTGRPANVGVIGVAVFTERTPVWRQRGEIARGGTACAGVCADGRRSTARRFRGRGRRNAGVAGATEAAGEGRSLRAPRRTPRHWPRRTRIRARRHDHVRARFAPACRDRRNLVRQLREPRRAGHHRATDRAQRVATVSGRVRARSACVALKTLQSADAAICVCWERVRV